MASLADVLAAAKKKAASTNFQRTAKPPMGKSVWRILPGWKAGDPSFFHAFGQHYIKGTDGKVKFVIGCPDKTFDEPCEVCEAIQEAARNAPSDKAREQILEARSTQRFLMNAVRVDEDPNKVVILEVGTGLFNDILANIEEDNDLIDPEKGRDLVITREGTGLNTRYSLATRSVEKSIKVAKSVLMNLNDLSEYVSDDFEAKKKKALSALGLTTGAILSGSSAAGALASPGAMSLEDELDDELPDFDAKAAAAAELDEVEDAELVTASDDEKKAAEASFGDDVSDDDIEKMLAGLD
ncbi:MAG: hypothetical protein LPK02_07415 [Rhodobacterales bacterium]|nr:hypothetical protein [Rhodobacterales bacterium]